MVSLPARFVVREALVTVERIVASDIVEFERCNRSKNITYGIRSTSIEHRRYMFIRLEQFFHGLPVKSNEVKHLSIMNRVQEKTADN